MHNPFDQLAKKIGKGALIASGATVVQYEISRDAQYADIRHDPDPARAAERARLGLLGRIAAVLCLIEVYSHAPEGREFRACIRKHFAHWEEHAARERGRNRRRKQKGLPPDPLAAPFLWIIVASVSAPMMAELKAIAAPGWPAGVYLHGGEVYRVGIIVADELPRDRSTLLVRIMAAGRGLADAIKDLAALPTDARERAVAEDILLHLQQQLGKSPSPTPEEEEFIVAMQSSWEKARKLGRDEGLAEGEVAARAEDVLTVLEARGVPVPEAARERVLAQKNPARLKRWLAKAAVASSLAEVIDDPS